MESQTDQLPGKLSFSQEIVERLLPDLNEEQRWRVVMLFDHGLTMI
jgi:hypothetical protein